MFTQIKRGFLLSWCFYAVTGIVTASADDEKPKSTAKYTFVDLRTWANQTLDGDFHGYTGNNLKPLPRGVQKLAGVDFEIGEKFVQLAGKRAPDFPEKVEGIRIGRKASSLHFLHGTGWGSPGIADGTEIGRFVIRYADDAEETLPIVYGHHVRDWWALAENDPVTEGEVAWKGTNDASKDFRGRAIEIRLFKRSWKNPHADKKITQIDYISKNETNCSPFLIALSLELPEDDQAAVNALKAAGAFVEFDSTGRVNLVSLSGPGPVADVNRGSDRFLAHLSKLPALETAYLNSPGFTDSGMEYLTESDGIRWLSLNLSRVSDVGLEQLKGLSHLERLRLHKTSVTDAGLVHLEALTRLKVLDLSQTKVTDAGLIQLAKMTELEELDLRRTNVTNAGVDRLCKSLPKARIYR